VWTFSGQVVADQVPTTWDCNTGLHCWTFSGHVIADQVPTTWDCNTGLPIVMTFSIQVVADQVPTKWNCKYWTTLLDFLRPGRS
jgi:hypothetical protein